MIQDHYVFITITGLFLLLVLGSTLVSLQTPTGYYVKENNEKVMYCEPMKCTTRGLEPSGRYYCDETKCYRDCIQNGELIEMATFCTKE